MSPHSSRGSRVRTKVVALLVSLVALWAFAAYVTLQDGTNLLSLATFAAKVGRPSEEMVASLQAERRLSVVYLAHRTTANRDELAKQRTITDAAVATVRHNVADRTVRALADNALEQRLDEMIRQVGTLPDDRQVIDVDGMDRVRAGEAYTTIIDAAFRIYGSLVALDDEEAAARGRALVTLSHATELLSQEDSLIAGALAGGQLSSAERAQFIRLVGAQRFLYNEGVADLPESDQARYAGVVAGSEYRSFSALQDAISEAGPATPLPVTSAGWDIAVTPVQAQLRDVILKATDHGLELTKPVAVGVIIRLALAGGLGLLAVIASIIISITTARALVKQLERLRNAARDLASYRLPRVVQRLQHGEKVDVDVESPPLDFGRDEIGQVGQAFNDVQSTAIRVAVEQAELRRSVRDVFLSLARRSQALLHRQLGLLDVMERRATDAEELSELFRIDHLATRMRRNAENLIVLSGATAGRAWRRPVPMVDVLRGALAEVEDYTRVTVLPVVPVSLVGRAVGDVIHLLAELIENAVSFSPPQTVVRLGGSVVGNGFAIEIEDRGLGMGEQDRAQANMQLAAPPEFKLSSTARLGLYVVGKLAERHGIRVRLTESPYGGTTAIVLLPATLLADGGWESGDVAGRGGAESGDVAGRGRSDGRLDDGLDAASLATWAALAEGRHRIDADAQTPTARPALSPAQRSAVLVGRPEPLSTVESSDTGDSRGGEDTVDVASDEPTILTPSGLPWRPRERGNSQPLSGLPLTGLPLAGSENGRPGAVADPDIGRTPRPPDEIRSIMASYRSGTLRGRIDAARLNDPTLDPQWTDPTPHGPDEKG
jgi:signal transduction histidine kinase